MTKTMWTYVVVLSLLGAAGAGTYFYANQISSVQTTATVTSVQQVQPTNQESENNDEDIKRKTLEGIGTIKQLKPVNIKPAQR